MRVTVTSVLQVCLPSSFNVECDTPLLFHLYVNWFDFYSAYIRGSPFFDKAKIFSFFY